MLGIFTGTQPRSCPALLALIAFRNKQDFFGFIPRCIEQEDRARLVEPGQVVEVVFLLVFDQILDRCSKQDDHPIDFTRQPQPARLVLLERFAFECRGHQRHEGDQRDRQKCDSFHSVQNPRLTKGLGHQNIRRERRQQEQADVAVQVEKGDVDTA